MSIIYDGEDVCTVSNERKGKIVSAIIILVVVSIILKIIEYFGGDLEPDRTRGLKYRLEQSKQLESEQQTQQIIDSLKL